MGERRLRASELAGETTIPAIIRETEDGDLLRDALLENLHRAQLNPLEEASAYQQLMADFGATQEELAKRIARSAPADCEYPASPETPAVRPEEGCRSGHHRPPRRALLSLSTPEEMERLAERIVAEGLSVRHHRRDRSPRQGEGNPASARPASSVLCRSWGRASCRPCPTRTIRG